MTMKSQHPIEQNGIVELATTGRFIAIIEFVATMKTKQTYSKAYIKDSQVICVISIAGKMK